jgi:phosphatidylglycerophosphate synthase
VAARGFRSVFAQYRATLKAVEVEEVLDLILYRPLAFLVVKLAAPTPVSANHLSLMSLGSGLAAGFFFWQGDRAALLAGAIAYFICNIFDCADGQLARLRNSRSFVGYLLDGSADYLSAIAVYIGIAHGLFVRHEPNGFLWVIVAVGGAVSAGWLCFLLDRKRQEWMCRVYGQRSDPEAEVAGLRRQAAEWRARGTHRVLRFVLGGYLFYRGFWSSLLPPAPPVAGGSDPEGRWARAHLPGLRLAAASGPTLQMTAIIIAGALNQLEVYLWGMILLGNCWGLLVLLTENAAERKLARRLPEVA